MRDLDLGAPVTDTRRLEVVVDGLPLFGGVQLAVDTTLVSTLNCDGSAHRGTADRDGVVLETEASQGTQVSRTGRSAQPCQIGGACR